MQDVLLGLMGVYNSTKTENVKATTASTISRLLRSNPELLPVLLDNSGVQLLLQGACSDHSGCRAELIVWPQLELQGFRLPKCAGVDLHTTLLVVGEINFAMSKALTVVAPRTSTGLCDSSSKVQVSSINILNLALSEPECAAALAPSLQTEQGALLTALSGLLDHSLVLLRAKGLVAFMLLCR